MSVADNIIPMLLSFHMISAPKLLIVGSIKSLITLRLWVKCIILDGDEWEGKIIVKKKAGNVLDVIVAIAEPTNFATVRKTERGVKEQLSAQCSYSNLVGN